MFDIRLLCPREQALSIEQRVTTRFLTRVQKRMDAAAVTKSDAP